jgi:molecular chaperone GrpE
MRKHKDNKKERKNRNDSLSSDEKNQFSQTEPADKNDDGQPIDMNEKMAREQKKAQEYFDQMLRIQAEFENYRKRVNKEKSELRKYANENLLAEMINIIDNFQRALTALEEHVTPENHKFYEGVEMIYKLLDQLLKSNGVEEMQAVGKPFDPRYHNAVQQVESDEVEPDHVVAEVSKGYMLNDRLLRAASVIVAKKAVSESDDESNTGETIDEADSHEDDGQANVS